jgi:retinol dehydrogenase 12
MRYLRRKKYKIIKIMAKRALITGANSGIGYATAEGLLAAGYALLIWARSIEKAESARILLLAKYPQAEIAVFAADLSDLKAVSDTATAIAAQYDSLDVLINNAGYYPQSVKFNALNIEETLYASHFGHFLLTRILLPLLERGSDARIVNVSSTAHRFGSANRFFTKGASNTFQAYSDAKLANVIFTLGFRLQQPQSNVRAYSLHPGVIDTNLPNKAKGLFKFLFWLARPFLSTPKKRCGDEHLLGDPTQCQYRQYCHLFR